MKKKACCCSEGTMVDATIISAPTSTKHPSGRRDPHMHQTKQGNEWHVGMKMHMGVDETLGVIHSLETTPAHVHDMTQTETLLHGKEKTCWGDAGDQGVDKRDALADSDIDWEIAVHPGKRKTLNQREQRLEHKKAQGARQGKTSVEDHQTAVWLQHRALPWTGKTKRMNQPSWIDF